MQFKNLTSLKRFAELQPLKNNIWESDNFTVSLVCLQAGTTIAAHGEPYAVFFYVLEGRGNFTTAEGTVELAAGDGLSIAAGETRGIACREDLVILGIHDPH